MGLPRIILALLLALLTGSVLADEATAVAEPGYRLQPGDVIDISVWKEQDLQHEMLIRPDGGLNFPLAGEIDTTGKTVEDVRSILAERLKRYVPMPVVTVALKSIGGNRIYVLGKVNKAGEFPIARSVDVMQALSLAGGTTPFAALNDIVILRRQNGQQQAFPFHYSDVARGRDLSQNIELQSGDTVVVP
ncbi:MAG TPA: polysaccharide biosynthesis/export family protein [Steroidobacteraceae bacterium]|nr:polysaccharide biosynthesis/export family protein [Steroidobacteraceae bacterium]